VQRLGLPLAQAHHQQENEEQDEGEVQANGHAANPDSPDRPGDETVPSLAVISGLRLYRLSWTHDYRIPRGVRGADSVPAASAGRTACPWRLRRRIARSIFE
jgi:hypothetical protein